MKTKQMNVRTLLLFKSSTEQFPTYIYSSYSYIYTIYTYIYMYVIIWIMLNR